MRLKHRPAPSPSPHTLPPAIQLAEKRRVAEQMIVQISSRFMHLHPDEIDEGIQWALQSVGEWIGADIGRVFTVSEDGNFLTNTHEWCAPDVPPQKARMPQNDAWRNDWYHEKLISHDYIYVRTLDDIPASVENFKQDLQARNVETLLTVPMLIGEKLIGLLGMDTLNRTADWTVEDIGNIKVVAELIGLAIERQQADAAMRYRLGFEQLVAEISARFVTVEPDQLDDALNYALQAIGEFANVDASRLFLRQGDPPIWSNTHEWCAPGIDSQRVELTDVRNWRLAQWWTNEMATHKMVYIVDTEKANAETNGLFADFIQRGIKSALSVPLLRGEEYIGELGLDAMRHRKIWSAENIRLLGVITQILINALDRRTSAEALKRERQSLETRVHERTLELQQLLNVSQVFSSTLELEPLLRVILEQLKRVVNYDAASIFARQDAQHPCSMTLLARVQQGPITFSNTWSYCTRAGVYERDLLEGRHPIIISDTLQDDVYAAGYHEIVQANAGPTQAQRSESAIEVPLVVRDKVIGSLLLENHQRGYYHEQHAKLVAAFANQAAVAIENARLHQQAIQAAALAERARLARELHDSVSQALFGIVLGTQTMMQLNPDKQLPQLKESMSFVLSLSEAALAEIRSLIFELRPESLQKEGLLAAYRKQTDAIRARHKIEVLAELGNREPALSLEVKEALYRIALEAMQNTVKHARANCIRLRLDVDPDSVLLTVSDNGCGFDLQLVREGHYGLQTMRERAQQFGGQFEVQSGLAQGTTVRVRFLIQPDPAAAKA